MARMSSISSSSTSSTNFLSEANGAPSTSSSSENAEFDGKAIKRVETAGATTITPSSKPNLSTSSKTVCKVVTAELGDEINDENVTDEAQKIVDALKKNQSLKENLETMLFLEILDLVNLGLVSGSEGFWAANATNTNNPIPFDQRALILNNNSSPVKLFIPRENDQSASRIIIPKIIFQDAKATLADPATNDSVSYLAPSRAPNQNENSEVRKIIGQALKAFYGDVAGEELQNQIRLITSPERLELPITIKDINSILTAVRDEPLVRTLSLPETFLSNLTTFTKQELDDLDKKYQKQPATNNEITLDAEKAHQTLTEPHENLVDAAGHGVDMVGRAAVVGTGAVLAGVPAGVAMGIRETIKPLADVRTLTGGVAGAAIGSLAGGPIGGMMGASIGAQIGRMASDFRRNNMTDDERHISAIGAATLAGTVSMGANLGVLSAHPGANPVAYALLGGGASILAASAIMSVPMSFVGMILFGQNAAHYFRPGDALQRGREALLDWKKASEKAPEVLQNLKQEQTDAQNLKTSLQEFFNTSREKRSNPSSAPADSHILKKEIAVIDTVEKTLIEEVDKYLEKSGKLIVDLEAAMAKQADQKSEHHKWKGIYGSDTIGDSYRRPGI